MNINEIPSNELVVMTDFWHRAFNAAGCDPGCHCCEKSIPAGAKFKLSTIRDSKEQYTNHPNILQDAIDQYDEIVETKEVMLCDECTPEKYRRVYLKSLKDRIDRHKDSPATQGCFRVNGKIVH